MVGVLLLVLSSLCVHLVSLTGSNQLVGLVEQSRVQRVSVDQTDQVLSVVLPAGTGQRCVGDCLKKGVFKCFMFENLNKFAVSC